MGDKKNCFQVFRDKRVIRIIIGPFRQTALAYPKIQKHPDTSFPAQSTYFNTSSMLSTSYPQN
jgi:hypothetical protein